MNLGADTHKATTEAIDHFRSGNIGCVMGQQSFDHSSDCVRLRLFNLHGTGTWISISKNILDNSMIAQGHVNCPAATQGGDLLGSWNAFQMDLGNTRWNYLLNVESLSRVDNIVVDRQVLYLLIRPGDDILSVEYNPIQNHRAVYDRVTVFMGVATVLSEDGVKNLGYPLFQPHISSSDHTKGDSSSSSSEYPREQGRLTIRQMAMGLEGDNSVEVMETKDNKGRTVHIPIKPARRRRIRVRSANL